MRRIAYVAFGFALGVLVGWLVRRNQGDGGGGQAQSAAGASVAVVSSGATSEAAAAPSRPASQHSPDQGGGAPTVELQRLRARVAELEGRLATGGTPGGEGDGSTLKRPVNLDARFDQERIRGALNAAFRESGLDGEVTAVDCTEYPCLLVGQIKGAEFGPEESDRVAKASALAAYGGDSQVGFGSSTTDKAGNRKNVFGVAVFPKATDDAERQQVQRRLRHRFGEIQDVE